MNHRLDYTVTGRPAASETFRQATAFLSGVDIRYALRVMPYPRTSFALIARFQSETTWSQFREAETGEPVRLPAQALIDATFSKQLAGPLLRVHLTVRNLTRGTTVDHPIAPQRDMVFIAGIRATLP
ncbi:MAG: hypothetical protein HKN29_04410 [Rhodothermales bacterium]|nr:hypothetical protein [Rhodothermales bacterium]